MSSTPKLLNFTPFKSLDKWYVEYYINAKKLSSNYDMISLRKIITPIKRRIKKTEYDGSLPVVSKIVFKTGNIIFRKENKTGMDLLHVKKGDMLVSSINFHQGAIALNETSDFVCSTHYQTFLIDETQVIPEYLIRVLRSSIFIDLVAGIKANGIKNESLFGLSVKASLEQKRDMIPVLRMSNIANGMIDYSELKYLPQKCVSTPKEPDKWLLKPGDFLITRTNGSKDLVGKAAVFTSNDTYTYASYLIRYRFNTSHVYPEYVNILFMTPIVREQIAVMRRQGGGQYNLNSDEINAIQIPVPPLPIQKKIIDTYNSTKDGSKEFYAKADACKKEAEDSFVNSIFL